MAAMLQINFNFSVTNEEYRQTAVGLAEQFANVPGLVWKIWILNEENSEAGGIYLFDSKSSIEEFSKSGLAAMVMSHPALSNFSVKPFAVMEEATAITRGPLTVNA